MKSKTTVQRINERENSRQDRQAIGNQSAGVGKVALKFSGVLFFPLRSANPAKTSTPL